MERPDAEAVGDEAIAVAHVSGLEIAARSSCHCGEGLIAQLADAAVPRHGHEGISGKHAPCGLCGLGQRMGSAGTRRSNSSVMSGEPSMSGSMPSIVPRPKSASPLRSPRRNVFCDVVAHRNGDVGEVERKRAMARGSSSAATEGSTATTTRPRRRAARSATAPIVASKSSSRRSARQKFGSGQGEARPSACCGRTTARLPPAPDAGCAGSGSAAQMQPFGGAGEIPSRATATKMRSWWQADFIKIINQHI